MRQPMIKNISPKIWGIIDSGGEREKIETMITGERRGDFRRMRPSQEEDEVPAARLYTSKL